MISFRTRTASVASSMILLALALFVGSAIWISQPLPNETGVGKGKPASIAKIEKSIDLAKATTDAAQAATAPLLWGGTAEQVGPQALSIVTKLTQAHHLKIVAFRPQKPVDVSGVTQLPFSIAVEGAYPDTMQLVKELETTNSKLAVSLIQVAAADSSSDHVTGTINLVAYMKTAPTPTGGSHA